MKQLSPNLLGGKVAEQGMAEIHSLVACPVGKHKVDEILKSWLIGEYITRSIGQLSVRAVPKPRNIEDIPRRPTALRLPASHIDVCAFDPMSIRLRLAGDRV